MDSQKSTALWTALGVFVGILMGIPAWITLVLMLWFRWYPDPAQEPDVMAQAGALMTGWLPLIVVSVSALLSALMLLLVIVKRWKNGQLKRSIQFRVRA
jgi:hypothetical protein